jgi:hypothetical protein
LLLCSPALLKAAGCSNRTVRPRVLASDKEAGRDGSHTGDNLFTTVSRFAK